MNTAVDKMFDRFAVDSSVREFIAREPAIFIDGSFCKARGLPIETFEPSTGQVLTLIAGSSADDVDSAVAAARRALQAPEWRRMKPLERQRLLTRIADLLEQESNAFAQIETIDSGKAISGCLPADILGSVDVLRFMAGLAAHVEGATREISAPGDFLAMSLKEPIGVVGCIVPWNFPLNTTVWKIAAPLAAGCTVVVKPDVNTSLSTLWFADLCRRAGLPAGVFNVVTGAGADAGSRLVEHPGIDRISFTGSTRTGRLVGAAAGAKLKPATLELGGKSPMIVCADADPEAVAAATRGSVFFNAGQVCSAGSRIYAVGTAFSGVVETVAQVARSLRIGPGLDPQTELGPVATRAHQQRVEGYIERAVRDGGKVTSGQAAPDKYGYWVRPTVILPGSAQDECVREEIFGPVVTIIACRDTDEAVSLANSNPYGLAASVWTRDLSRAIDLVRRVEAGTVWVNSHDIGDPAMAFGGFKQSGFGKDLGIEQFEECFRTKSVTIAL
jgi:phenylacetaldehyde dehydrogenase